MSVQRWSSGFFRGQELDVENLSKDNLREIVALAYERGFSDAYDKYLKMEIVQVPKYTGLSQEELDAQPGCNGGEGEQITEEKAKEAEQEDVQSILNFWIDLMVDETRKPLVEVLRNVCSSLGLNVRGDATVDELQQLLENVDDKQLESFLKKHNVIPSLSEQYHRLNNEKNVKEFESIDQTIRVPLL